MLMVADFETVNDIEDCRVWAYSCIEIGNYDNYQWGTSLDEFMWNVAGNKHSNDTIWFHNLKFDGEFIQYFLFRNGFTHVKNRKQMTDKTFTTLISDKGQFYSIEVCFKKKGHKVNKCTFYDSLKILNFSVEKIAKDFHLPCLKGDIDYNKHRPVGYKLDKNEQSYIRNDVEIVARALEQMFANKMDKMTIGSDALSSFKEMFGKKFDRFFPILDYDVDEVIRRSYKGGYSYVSDKYRGKTIDTGLVYDVNSLYPSRMRYELLPVGQPIPFNGKYEEDKLHPLYVQCITCQFELKPNHLPTIQIKNSRFCDTEYLKTSGDEPVDLTMTNIDLELFFDHYEVFNIEYHGGFKFVGKRGVFDEYVDYWTEQKIKAKKEKNGAMYVIAKLMLNSLYGKFALNPKVRSKYPIYNETGDIIKYEYGEYEIREPIYIPMGTFITAYARNQTIRSAQKCFDRFAYADTDSIHIEGYEVPEGLDIDEYRLGAWKCELIITHGKYIRQKTYMEKGFEPEDVNKIFDYKFINPESSKNPIFTKVTCAGMPPRIYPQVTFDNFEIGGEYFGRLNPKHVSGGICLVESTFKIKGK